MSESETAARARGGGSAVTDLFAGAEISATNRLSQAKSPTLRPYQLAAIAEARERYAAGMRRLLLPLPTGGGKTVIASGLIAGAVQKGSRVVFVAHRRELVAQASAKLFSFGVDHGVIQAGHPTRPQASVQVCSIQTLYARAIRSATMALPPADVLVIDECHHARAVTYQAILNAYPGAAVLGLSATPCRGDGLGLGNLFEAMVACPSVQELIDLGYLVRTRVYAPAKPDLTGIRVQRGDYVERQLAERMDQQQLVGDIVDHWLRLAERRKTVAFATSVEHSLHLRDEFRLSNVWAEHVDGSTPPDERDAILARLGRGEVEVVTNCMLLTEGWDQPDVSCLILARPTKSMALYRQMVGRVLRPAVGKADALVLDHAGATFEHGLAEEPVEWTLRTDRRTLNPVQAARQAGTAPRLSACPECTAVRMSGAPCPACGWRPRRRGRGVDVVDGELARLDRDRRAHVVGPTAGEKLHFHRMLTWIARERDYVPGWIAHKFKEKFGHWPADRHVDPAPPDDVTRRWLRSRDIAYAKARQKAGAA